MRFLVVCLTVLIWLSATGVSEAQKLATLLPTLLSESTTNAQTPSGATGFVGLNHDAHFFVGQAQKTSPLALNKSIATQLATFPIASSAGGFAFNVGADGIAVPARRTFGPAFSERAITIGRGQMNFGFSFQNVRFDAFEGIDLDSGNINFAAVHSDCCPPGLGDVNVPTDAGPFTPRAPGLELDLLDSTISALDIESQTTTLSASFGVTDRVDVAVAIPIVRVDLQASLNTELLRFGTQNDELIHSFDGEGANRRTLAAGGSATGIGDVLIRSKYNFFKRETGGLAAAIDLRLPTGDEEDLLGTGTTQTKLFLIASGEFGGIAPHGSIGYTWSGGETTPLLGAWTPDPSIGLNDPASFGAISPSEIDLQIPNEINYTFGITAAAHSRVSVGLDVIGRSLLDTNRFGRGPVTFEDRLPFGVDVTRDELVVSELSGTTNLMFGSAGAKIEVVDRLLLNVMVLFSMLDNGLSIKPTPVIGFDYVFGG